MTNKSFVELEKPAIWRPIRNTGISIRKYSGGYPYQKRGIFGASSITNPVIRYANNYNKYKIDYSLVLFTNETDISAVESYFQSLNKKIKKEEILKPLSVATMSNMAYIDSYYDEGKK